MSRDRLTRVIPFPSPDRALTLAVDAFILDREAMRCTPQTLHAYRYALGGFLDFLKAQGVHAPQDITPAHIRAFFVSLGKRGLADTTVHLHARAVKTLCGWLLAEGMITNNPMERVSMPRLDKKILPAFSPDDVRKLLAACHSPRDTAIVLCLLDSGCRASEFVALDVGDVDMRTGAVHVGQGKGRKDRVTFLGAKARRALLKYLATRKDARPEDPLWVSETTGERLTQNGLALLLRRLGKRAGVKDCSPHTFRRSFALWSLRAGMDVYSLQRLMGHSDLTVLQEYLALAQGDLEGAHRQHGAVDNML